MFHIVKPGVGYWDGGMFRPSKAFAREYATKAEAVADAKENEIKDNDGNPAGTTGYKVIAA